MMEGTPIPGFPGYTATQDGQILGKRLRRPLRPRARGGRGRGHHLRVRIYSPSFPARTNGKRWRDVYVHVLVCLAFHGPPPFEGALVLHGDDDPTNNDPENLRWGTPLENYHDRADARATSRDPTPDGFDWATGTYHPQHKD